jgi:hypothetical protein
MARPKKIGNEKCPYPECGELGYEFQKSARNRPGSKYVYRYWFHHNDSNIGDHYVDNFYRAKVKENVFYKMSEEYLKMAYYFEKRIKKIASFKPTKEEWNQLVRDLQWHELNIVNPLIALAAIDIGKIEGKVVISPEFHRELREFALENIRSTKNPLGRGYKELYEKYERPLEIDRNKKRNKKLSEGNGRRTNSQFTGIEEEEPINSKIKP